MASYEIGLLKPGAVSIEFGTDTSYGRSTWQQHTEAGSNLIQILVAGMKAKTTYHMRAHIEYDDGTTADDADHTFTTGILAGPVPPLTVTANSAMTPQPGIEMVDPIAGGYYAPFATDLDGTQIWSYYPAEIQGKAGNLVYPVKLLSNGHLMCFISTLSSLVTPVTSSNAENVSLLREFDLAGDTIRQITISELNTKLAAAGFNLTLQVFTHDFEVLPNGHVLVIANTIKSFTNLPGYPGTTNVIGDVVVDLDTNFNPVWVWNSFDHLDVNRHPMNFPDWTHANAIAYSADDGDFLISMRHQSWIVKVDYRDGAGTGAVKWRLGEGGDFKLTNGVDPDNWFYAQHDVNFVSSNTTGNFKITLFDNGNNRLFSTGLTCGATGAPACYSTVPVIQVDENAMTATYIFHKTLPTFSICCGNARVQENGNIEYDQGFIATPALHSEVDEVTQTSNPQTVWTMTLTTADNYRAIRISSLYPGVQW